VVEESLGAAPDLERGLEQANLTRWDGACLTADTETLSSTPVLVIRRFFAPFGV
jgi:hypothetical protein